MFERKAKKNFIQSNVEFFKLKFWLYSLDSELKSKNQELMYKLFDSMNEKTKTVNKRNSKNCI